MLICFLLSSFALEYIWSTAHGTGLERWIIDDVTIQTSVAAINALTPHVAAVAQGATIAAQGGGINVRNGCEGTELLFPLIGALLAYPFSLVARLWGVLTGTLLVFALNQARLLTLFYSLRNDRAMFNAVHGFVGPLVLIACVLAFFVLLLRWDEGRRSSA